MTVVSSVVSAISFNRYMVECELGCQISPDNTLSSFNRYMVECELNSIS